MTLANGNADGARVEQLRATFAAIERLDPFEADERVFALLGHVPSASSRNESWRACGPARGAR